MYLIFYVLLLSESSSYFTCETTEGEDGWTEGSMCSFPFTYNSETYHSCITERNWGTYWCYTEPGGSDGSPWGDCIMDTCRWGK